jgi:hypothetical protein
MRAEKRSSSVPGSLTDRFVGLCGRPKLHNSQRSRSSFLGVGSREVGVPISLPSSPLMYIRLLSEIIRPPRVLPPDTWIPRCRCRVDQGDFRPPRSSITDPRSDVLWTSPPQTAHEQNRRRHHEAPQRENGTHAK